MRYLALLTAGAVACGGTKAPETTVSPSRGLRALTIDDPEVTAIANAATRALPSMGSSSSGTHFFAGVYVNGRRARLATDAVVRTTGYTAVSSVPKRTTVECRAVSSSAQSRPVQCPAAARATIPPTFTFDEVRATADSAYVGITETNDMAEKSSCVTLVRRGTTWTYLGSAIVANGKLCGK